jgi:hypothetical protein
MTSGGPCPSEALKTGRRALDGIAGCRIVEDFRVRAGYCILHLRLEPSGLEPTEFVPASTDWILLAEDIYPDGFVGLLPAKEKGLVHTFPHQELNVPRSHNDFLYGQICTNTSLRLLGRHGLDREPRTAEDRIRWHVLQALRWLEAAAKDELVLPGEPFELPVYRSVGSRVVGFLEDEATFSDWEKIKSRAGLVELVRDPDNDRISVVRQISTWAGEPLLTPRWGKKLSASDEVETAIWVGLDRLPVLQPWQLPTTGKELHRALRESGADLSSFLRAPDRLRDGRSHLVLLGFPIPRRYGEVPERLHWLAVALPPFSQGNQRVAGFRSGRKGWLQRDRRKLLGMSPLPWIQTENWSPDEISTRGRFNQELRDMEILLIGAGALGSAVAELLVRGGAHKLTVMDGDILAAGNVVRHSLTMADVERPKAEALAAWLNAINPHAGVEFLSESFPPRRPEAIGGAGMVLDCTGDDDLLARLARFPWPGERWFVSAALGFEAQRLFVFTAKGGSFPKDAMVTALQPWLAEERARFPDELPWEGIGCRSPIFPARIEDVRLFAAILVKKLEHLADGRLEAPSGLLVFERSDSDCLVRQLGS